jgi:signal transduction histidine kinase
MLARILQEALANAFRHARPSLVSVRLTGEPEAAHLSVVNDGVTPADRAPGAGHGIIGMRERAHGGGGSLHAGPAPIPGSWQVELRLPRRNTTDRPPAPQRQDPLPIDLRQGSTA